MNAELLDADVFDHRSASSGDEHLLDFEILLFATDVDAHGDGILTDFDVTDLGTGQNIDFPLLEAARELCAAVRVFQRENAGKYLDERDLGPESSEDIGELTTDGAGSDDRHGLGRLLQNQRFVGGDDARLVELEADLWQAFHS